MLTPRGFCIKGSCSNVYIVLFFIHQHALHQSTHSNHLPSITKKINMKTSTFTTAFVAFLASAVTAVPVAANEADNLKAVSSFTSPRKLLGIPSNGFFRELLILKTALPTSASTFAKLGAGVHLAITNATNTLSAITPPMTTRGRSQHSVLTSIKAPAMFIRTPPQS